MCFQKCHDFVCIWYYFVRPAWFIRLPEVLTHVVSVWSSSQQSVGWDGVLEQGRSRNQKDAAQHKLQTSNDH